MIKNDQEEKWKNKLGIGKYLCDIRGCNVPLSFNLQTERMKFGNANRIIFKRIQIRHPQTVVVDGKIGKIVRHIYNGIEFVNVQNCSIHFNSYITN